MATNYAQATYTEIIDLQTTADKISIVGIHTPVGQKAYARLAGFFKQFRKFKYNGIKSMIMVPAANLPVDPLGLTGVVGTTDLMDPRDMLNPILFHGCHGEDLTTVLNTIYRGNVITKSGAETSSDGSDLADSAEMFDINIANDLFEYYSKLTDSSWRKFGIQQGVKLKNLYPLVHQVAQNMPTLPAGLMSDIYLANAGLFEGVYSPQEGQVRPWPPGNVTSDPDTINIQVPVDEVTKVHQVVNGNMAGTYGRAYKQQFTNRMTTLGWLPTSLPTDQSSGSAARITTLPKLFMGVMILPPAYNVEQFFRMVITHSFSFKEFTSSLSLMDSAYSIGASSMTANVPYFNWIDYGDTLDSIGAKSTVVSDGVM